MSQKIERRRFLEIAGLSFLTTVTVTISRCGSSSSGGGGGGTTTPDHNGSIAGNHGHAATVTAAQLNAGAGVTLDIKGTSDHTHSLALTADQVVAIKANTQVAVTSSTGGTDGHTHVITFNNPGNVPAPAPAPSSGGGW